MWATVEGSAGFLSARAKGLRDTCGCDEVLYEYKLIDFSESAALQCDNWMGDGMAGGREGVGKKKCTHAVADPKRFGRQLADTSFSPAVR